MGTTSLSRVFLRSFAGYFSYCDFRSDPAGEQRPDELAGHHEAQGILILARSEIERRMCAEIIFVAEVHAVIKSRTLRLGCPSAAQYLGSPFLFVAPQVYQDRIDNSSKAREVPFSNKINQIRSHHFAGFCKCKNLLRNIRSL